jgi:hypothetical protein
VTRSAKITILVILIFLSALLSRWVGPLEAAWNLIDPPGGSSCPGGAERYCS